MWMYKDETTTILSSFVGGMSQEWSCETQTRSFRCAMGSPESNQVRFNTCSMDGIVVDVIDTGFCRRVMYQVIVSGNGTVGTQNKISLIRNNHWLRVKDNMVCTHLHSTHGCNASNSSPLVRTFQLPIAAASDSAIHLHMHLCARSRTWTGWWEQSWVRFKIITFKFFSYWRRTLAYEVFCSNWRE